MCSMHLVRRSSSAGVRPPTESHDGSRVRGGLQRFPDISVDNGKMHAIWWDSRNDSCYSPKRPIGNCVDKSTVASLNAFGASGSTATLTWSPSTRLNTVTSNPNYEQFGGRTVPFGGDYLYTSSVGSFAFSVWTDWRNTVAGIDPREGADSDHDAADVHQCRAPNSSGGFGSDTCPFEGGL